MTAEVPVDPRPASLQSGKNKRGGSNSSHKCQNSWPSLPKDLPAQFTKIEVVAKIVTSTLTFNGPVTLPVIDVSHRSADHGEWNTGDDSRCCVRGGIAK